MGSPQYFFKYGILFATSTTLTFAALAYFAPTPNSLWAAPTVAEPYFTGGTVVEQYGIRIHTFTSSGTLTMVTPGGVE